MSSDIPNTNVSFSSMRDAYNNTFDTSLSGSISLSDFRNAQLSGNAIVPTGTSAISLGNIRNKKFTLGYFLQGHFSDGIRFSAGIIPSNFTIISVSRYHPESERNNQERIFDSTNGNWLHGHWDSRSGVAHYDGWKTQHGSDATGYVKNRWLTFAGQNRNGLSNSVSGSFTSSNGTHDITFTNTFYARYVRVYLEDWSGHPSMRTDVYVEKNHMGDKYSELNYTLEGNRTYSSVHGSDAIGTGHARSMISSVQAWSASSGSPPHWIQLDLGSRKKVTGIKVIPRNNVAQYVTQFRLEYGDTSTLNMLTIDGQNNIYTNVGGNGNRTLSINHGAYIGNESSHWQIREFIVWNTYLSSTELASAYTILNAKKIPAQNPSWPKSGNIVCWFHASTFPSASSTNANWPNSYGSLDAGYVSRGTVTRVEKKRYKNARKVKVKQDSSSNMYMNISEVRVFNPSGTNIANTSTATHTNTYNSWPASRAIDGNTSTSTHTYAGKNNWLLLTFPNNVVIDYIEIVNRTGYLNGNRTPTSIEILDSSNNVLFSQVFRTWTEQTKYVEIY